MRLTPRLHDRDTAGLKTVYPVVSRRAGGVSVGINLNPNNACNWRCIYCQVPGLVFGKAPEVDLELLASELDQMLDALVNGDYLERHVPEGSRRINDVAFSGNGEPTSSPQFAQAVDVAVEALERFELAGRVKLVLITNGSLVHGIEVQDGLARIARAGGEIWFKLDAATEEGQARINNARSGIARTRTNLSACASLCPTWVQTMAFAHHGEVPAPGEVEAYLSLLASVLAEGVALRGVLLYGLARPSRQPEAPDLSPLPRAWMEALADRIRATGLEVRLSP